MVLPATHKYQVTLLINNFVNKEHIYTLLKIKSPLTVGIVVEEEVRCEWLAGWLAIGDIVVNALFVSQSVSVSVSVSAGCRK